MIPDSFAALTSYDAPMHVADLENLASKIGAPFLLPVGLDRNLATAGLLTPDQRPLTVLANDITDNFVAQASSRALLELRTAIASDRWDDSPAGSQATSPVAFPECRVSCKVAVALAILRRLLDCAAGSPPPVYPAFFCSQRRL